jgi:hypothetical protein
MAVLTGYTRRDRGDFMRNHRMPPRRADFSSNALDAMQGPCNPGLWLNIVKRVTLRVT